MNTFFKITIHLILAFLKVNYQRVVTRLPRHSCTTTKQSILKNNLRQGLIYYIPYGKQVWINLFSLFFHQAIERSIPINSRYRWIFNTQRIRIGFPITITSHKLDLHIITILYDVLISLQLILQKLTATPAIISV